MVSYADLDQKNVLWNADDKPILIDWESARKVNPTYEIVNASLDWNGITTDRFNEKRFIAMICAYKTAGGIIDKRVLEAAFYGVLGNWFNWMAYNIKRACVIEESAKKQVGIREVNQVLATIIRLRKMIPGLLRSLNA